MPEEGLHFAAQHESRHSTATPNLSHQAETDTKYQTQKNHRIYPMVF